ncbi:hypothetical protein CRE_11567 [Caenorhabditis remanei]|uniref:Uncharacterized protein n=1 Tax=Caenorhabditis remanei TaxID=31234 RepID=E3NNV3_CAERE|nr:hypothetical protein CRE_11567 [Caenorhabditis remanei]
MNKLLKRSPKEDNPEIVPCFIFDEDASKEVEDETLLPGGVSLKIAMLPFPGISVNWVGRRAVSKAVVRILDLICSRDKYFLIYSSPDSDRPTTYPTLSLDFFTSFSTRKHSTVYSEKRRSKKKTEVDGLFAEFQQLIEIDSQFRLKEDPIHNLRSIPNVVKARRIERSDPISFESEMAENHASSSAQTRKKPSYFFSQTGFNQNRNARQWTIYF